MEGVAPKAQMVRMRNLLVEYVRSVPGALEDAWKPSKDIDISRAREGVLAELGLIEGQDESARKSEAERAMRWLNQEQLIWGGSMPQVVMSGSG
jgi:hypothetical protein